MFKRVDKKTAGVAPDAVFLAIVLIAQLPLLYLFFKHQWQRTHYQFYPILILAMIGLGWSRWPRVFEPLTLRLRRVVRALYALSLVLLFGSTLFFMPWMAASSALLALGAACLESTGQRGFRALLPVWLLGWLAINPPLRLDRQLIAWLQLATSNTTSHILEIAGISHLTLGNVVELPEKKLLVEEACSGVQSFFALLAATAVLLVWQRAHPLRAIPLLCMVLLWAGVGNVLRVLTICVVWVFYEVDLSTGWRHELLGFATFGVALVLVGSTDQIMKWLLAPLGELSAIESEVSPLSNKWNSFFLSEDDEWHDAEDLPDRVIVPPTGNSGIGRRLVWGTVMLYALGLQVYEMTAVQPDSAFEVALQLEQSALPPEVDGWKQGSFEEVERELSSIFGRFSKTWRYSSPHENTVVSCDFPFDRWHDLTYCYRGQGWTIAEQGVVLKSDDTEQPFAEIRMSQPTGEMAYLYFGLFDNNGRAVLPSGPETPLLTRVFRHVVQSVRNGPIAAIEGSFTTRDYSTIQVQLLVPVSEPLDADEREQLKERFVKFRELIRRHWSESGA
jgi:exosortase